MNKKIKSLLSVVLTFVMVFQLAPVFASDDNGEYYLNITFNDLPTNTSAIDGLTISGGKVKVVMDGIGNKALYIRNSTSPTGVLAQGVNPANANVVYSADIKADNMPANLTFGATTSSAASESADCVFLSIVNNVMYTNDGKKIGTINSLGFTTVSVVVKKSKLCDFYINNRLVLADWNLPKGPGSYLAIRQKSGNSCYIDKLRAYFGKKPNQKMKEAAVSNSFVDVIGQDDYAGDCTFFDNRYCYTSGAPKYNRISFYPKTNEIVTTRLIDYQSPTRTDYIYLNRTDETEDCFFDMNVAMPSVARNRNRTYKYFKIEGDFMTTKLGSPVQFPMLRDTSGSTQVSAYPCSINSDGSLSFAGGSRANGVFKKDTWVHCLLFFDIESHFMDAYVNGKKVASNIAITQDLKQLNLVRISLTQGELNDLYVDNFDFTGLEKPIVDGVETMTTVLPEATAVEEFLEDKIAMHAYGNILSKNGEKKEMATKGIYDKMAEQYYVPADTLSEAFDMNLTDNGGEISGDVSITADGTAVTADGKTVKLDPAPKVEAGKMYVPVKQFASDIAGKHVWFFKTGIYIFTDRELNLDTDGWEYMTMRTAIGSQAGTDWNDIDHLNNYLQYVRPDVERLKADYIKTTGDETFTQHPRVLLTDKDFDVFRKHYADGDDELYNKVAKQIIASADSYLELEPVHYKWDDLMRTLSAVSSNLLRRFINMGYAYQLTGDQKYVDKAFEQFEECATYPDYNTSHIIDTGDDCFALAVGFDWFYNGFTPEQREFAKTVVHDTALRTLASGLYGRLTSTSSGTNEWGSFIGMSNYNSIINGGVLTAAIATLEYDTDQTFTYIKDSIRSMEYSLLMLTPDGGWNEAPGYWSYAMRYIMTGGAALEKVFGTSYNLMDGQGMDNTLNYAISTLGTVGSNNYGDGGMSQDYSFNNFFYLGQRYSNPIASFMRRYDLNRGKSIDYYDAIFFDFDSANVTQDVMNELPKMIRTSGTEIVSFRDSYDKDVSQTYFSTHFGTTSGYHQHYDCGAFVLDLLGQRWAYDLGSDNYNLQNELKYPEYAIYRKRSESHNVLVFNESKYTNSVEMKLNQFAPVIDSQYNDYGGFVYADLDDVYNEASKMTLGYYLDDNMNSVTYRNEFTLNENAECFWSINTMAEIDIDGDTVYLSQNGKSVKIDLIYTGSGAHWEDLGHPQPASTSPQVPEQNANLEYKKLALKYNASKGDNKLIIKFSPMGMNIKPISDVPISEWKLPEKSDTESKYSANFKVYYAGTEVNGALPVYEGEMPKIDIVTEDPNAIVEVEWATNETEKTRIKVWDAVRNNFTKATVSYFKASGTSIEEYNSIPIQSVNVSSQPEPQNKMENMLDGDFTTRWTCMAYGEYAIFDLGSVQPIDGVALAFWRGRERNYFFDVYVSNDGENWTEAYIGGQSSGETEQLEAYGFDNTMNARYIKYVGQGNTVDSASKVNSNVLEFRALVNKF